jgi:hypothetical protein
MSKSTRRKDAKLNKTDRYFPQEYPSAEEIAEQKRIQAEILAEKMAAGPPELEGTFVRLTKVYSVSMLPGGKGVLRGQG